VKYQEEELDHLLALGALGGPGRERILEQALARTTERRRSSALAVGLASLAAAAAALVLSPGHASHFRAKGGGVGGTAVDLSCLGASLARCPTGSTLIFGSAYAPPGSYMAAYAEPLSGGERIWYFSAESESPAASAPQATHALSRGIRLGREHLPGEYAVRVVVTRRPLTRQDLRSDRLSGLVADARFRLVVAPP
jgi:hypothetical protein